MDGSVGRFSESKAGLDEVIIILEMAKKKGVGLERIKWIRWWSEKGPALNIQFENEQPRYLDRMTAAKGV